MIWWSLYFNASILIYNAPIHTSRILWMFPKKWGHHQHSYWDTGFFLIFNYHINVKIFNREHNLSHHISLVKLTDSFMTKYNWMICHILTMKISERKRWWNFYTSLKTKTSHLSLKWSPGHNGPRPGDCLQLNTRKSV